MLFGSCAVLGSPFGDERKLEKEIKQPASRHDQREAKKEVIETVDLSDRPSGPIGVQDLGDRVVHQI
jgi:hypothetical protein